MGSIATDLSFISDLLYKHGICNEKSKLKNAYTNYGNYWKCYVQKLQFFIKDIPRNTTPVIQSLEVYLTLEINEESKSKDDLSNSILLENTPGNIKQYNCSILIKGKSGKGNDYYTHWHLDYDGVQQTSDGFIHPDFHFTCGGTALKDSITNGGNGNLLILSTPRLPHPPLDVVLAIDFILNNFVQKNLSDKIKSDSRYKAAIKNAQARLWRPYMLSSAKHWCELKNCPNLSCPSELCYKYQPSLLK